MLEGPPILGHLPNGSETRFRARLTPELAVQRTHLNASGERARPGRAPRLGSLLASHSSNLAWLPQLLRVPRSFGAEPLSSGPSGLGAMGRPSASEPRRCGRWR